MDSAQSQFHELSFYTLSHGDKKFIHQHAVDAYTAQTADENTKPIGLIFALAGLYLLNEKNFTGRQVQEMHMRMTKNKKQWPAIVLPKGRGDITVGDVLAVAPGKERDAIIYEWCEEVWKAFAESREEIVNLIEGYFKRV